MEKTKKREPIKRVQPVFWPMFFNHNVSAEEELRQAIAWETAQKNSIARYSKLIEQFRKENPDLVREHAKRKLQVIYEKISNLKNEQLKRSRGSAEYILFQNRLDLLYKERKLIEISLTDNKNRITPEMIAAAKRYPIEDLINIPRSKFICCPFHDDHRPSAKLTDKNTLRCYSFCDKTYDSIDIYIHKNGGSFHDAVRALQR